MSGEIEGEFDADAGDWEAAADTGGVLVQTGSLALGLGETPVQAP